MATTRTPKYRIELNCISFVNKRREVDAFAFEGMKPTEANAKKWRDQMNASFDTHNAHLRDVQSRYSNAVIIEQKTGVQVAAYIAPMFELA